MCGLSPFDACERTRRQNQVFQRAGEKFMEELDIEKLLLKLRDSYDISKSMVKKNDRKLLQFDKRRVIDPDKEVESSTNSSGEEDLTSNLKSMVKNSILKRIIKDPTQEPSISQSIILD